MMGDSTVPPGLAGMETIARAALKTIPANLRRHVRGVAIRVEEFPDAETEREMGLESPFDLVCVRYFGSRLAVQAGPSMVWP